MKVSVIVATYRRRDELAEALTSLIGQRFDDFEVIVVDDNGDEQWNRAVKSIVEEFQEKASTIPITCIQNKTNMGSAATRNIGIAAARGEYITFLDDDDTYLPEKLSHQYAFMADQNIDFSIMDMDLYFDSGRLFEHKTRKYITQTDSASLFKYHFLYHMTGTDTMMFKTAYLRSLGGFPGIDSGDEFYLMHEAILGGGKFGYLPECCVIARVHTEREGLSSGQGKINGENQLFAFKKQYFSQLDRKSVHFITARHHAVLAFAYLRKREIGRFVKEGILAVASSPRACIAVAMGKF